MSADKIYCMSSYLAFRSIEDSTKEFFNGIRHNTMPPTTENEFAPVKSSQEIDDAIAQIFEKKKGVRLGLLLSGGMDSAILASYMKGCDAYTFRFLGGEFQKEELARAEYYANYYQMQLHYVDIDWVTVEKYIDALMKNKGAPVHSIEPQIASAAVQAQKDGITEMVIGNGSDYVFGGMDQLLAKDWEFNEFVDRYIYLAPSDVLIESADMRYVFEPYRQDKKIDFLRFLADKGIPESYNSYYNAFSTVNMPYCDPYAKLKMSEPLDLMRIRSGQSKYLIRELFSMKYPGVSIPEKNPMPRPVDFYFANWIGPKRPEFKKDLDLSQLTGNQKWQLWCLEHFLNLFENGSSL